jgi:hypothetical protein
MKDNYSTKKTNYLVGSQIEKYKHIMKEISIGNGYKEPISDSLLCATQSPFIHDPSDPSVSDLKADLEDFLSNITTKSI